MLVLPPVVVVEAEEVLQAVADTVVAWAAADIAVEAEQAFDNFDIEEEAVETAAEH